MKTKKENECQKFFRFSEFKISSTVVKGINHEVTNDVKGLRDSLNLNTEVQRGSSLSRDIHKV